MRFIQNDNRPQATKEKKEPTQKFGGKGGRTDYSALSQAKKIISPNGGRR